MAPVIVALGAKSGLIVPLVAVHMFVFYFGILADDTPPVWLAAFAAAAISGGDPIKTGIQGFMYDIRTAALPFMFLFNTELLLIDVSPVKAVFVFLVAAVAMMLFAAATQGYFFARSRIWESVILLLVAFSLFRPGFWLDKIQPPFIDEPGVTILEKAAELPDGATLRVFITGPDFDNADRIDRTTLIVPLGAKADGAERLKKAGLIVLIEDGVAKLEEPFPASAFEQELKGFEFYGDTPVAIETVSLPADRMPKEVLYIPALLLLGFVIMMQLRRQTVPAFWMGKSEEGSHV